MGEVHGGKGAPRIGARPRGRCSKLAAWARQRRPPAALWGLVLGAVLGSGLGGCHKHAATPRVQEPNDLSVPGGTTGPRVTALAAHGSDTTCAFLAPPAVKCWGENGEGELGLGDTVPRGSSPAQMGAALPALDVGTGRTVLALTTGYYSTCALLDDRTVKCWGRAENGRLGQGDTLYRGGAPGQMGDALPAVALPTARTALDVALGVYFSCALLDDRNVACWGANESGQLGLGDVNDRGGAPASLGAALPQVNLGSGRTALALSAGSNHVCALLDNHTVKCWGANGQGQLGLGDTQFRGDGIGAMGDELPAVALGSGRTAQAIGVSERHSCALLDDGTLKCWGENQFGELGLGDLVDRGTAAAQMGDGLPAVALGSGRTATGLAVGQDLVCALLDLGQVKCWGSNGAYQESQGSLGLGDTQDRGGAPGQMGDALPYVALW